MQSYKPVTRSFKEHQMQLSYKHLIIGKEKNVAEIKISRCDNNHRLHHILYFGVLVP